MTKNSGWIKLHRSLVGWGWFNDSKTLHVFLTILLNANIKDGEWQGTKIKKGQWVTGRKKLSDLTGISEQSIRTCLKKLEKTGELTIKSTSKFSIITVVKWDTYQIKEKESTKKLTNNQPTTNHKQEVKKERKIIPPEREWVVEYCRQRENGIDADEFISHYDSNGWMRGKNKIVDWQACVRTWENKRKNNPKKKEQVNNVQWLPLTGGM